jgi:putative transposase
MTYLRDEHRTHHIVYHLAWAVKRRKAMLVGAVGDQCKSLIESKCAEAGWEIIKLAIQPDHVYLVVRVWPPNSAEDVVKRCKGITSHTLRKAYPELLKLPSLWTRGYFAATAGAVSDEDIRAYMKTQR